MCIIVVSPIGYKLPKRKYLERCFKNNPDGAGLMYNTKDGIQIRKGFLYYYQLEKELNSLGNEIKVKEHNIVLHFRLATHGNIDESTCHPFPITDNVSELESVNILCEYGIVHNGIINWADDKNKNLSDSQIFIRDCLSKISRSELTKTAFHQLMIQSTGSKFCILHKDRTFLIGNFIKEKSGIYYSNTTYKSYTKYYTEWEDYASDKYWQELEDKYSGKYSSHNSYNKSNNKSIKSNNHKLVKINKP